MKPFSGSARWAVGGVATGLAVASGAVAVGTLTPPSPPVPYIVHVCWNPHEGSWAPLHISKNLGRCPVGWVDVGFNSTGRRGPRGFGIGRSGLSAAQLRGIPGQSGPEGATGATGPQGVTGATGAAGPQGPQGPTGAIGLSYPQGASGPTGALFGEDDHETSGHAVCPDNELVVSAGYIISSDHKHDDAPSVVSSVPTDNGHGWTVTISRSEDHDASVIVKLVCAVPN